MRSSGDDNNLVPEFKVREAVAGTLSQSIERLHPVRSRGKSCGQGDGVWTATAQRVGDIFSPCEHALKCTALTTNTLQTRAALPSLQRPASIHSSR